MNNNVNNTILPLLVFITLLKETNKDKPMTVNEIKEFIINEYDVYISNRTIERHLSSFRDFDFGYYKIHNIKRKGFYLENLDPLFDDSEINYLKSLLKRSKNMSKKLRQDIINKLDTLGGDNINKKDIEFVETSEQERKDYSSIIDIISSACNESKKLEITYIVKDGSFKNFNYFTFRPYLHTIIDEDRILVGFNESTKKIGYIPLSRIYAVKELNKTFKKTKLLIKLPKNVLGVSPNSLPYKLLKEYPNWFYKE